MTKIKNNIEILPASNYWYYLYLWCGVKFFIFITSVNYLYEVNAYFEENKALGYKVTDILFYR